MNKLYYRIYHQPLADKFAVVCMQWFDEMDYTQSRFLTDPETNVALKFLDETDAIQYLNDNIKPEFIDGDFKKFDTFSKYRI